MTRPSERKQFLFILNKPYQPWKPEECYVRRDLVSTAAILGCLRLLFGRLVRSLAICRSPNLNDGKLFIASQLIRKKKIFTILRSRSLAVEVPQKSTMHSNVFS